MVGVFWVSLSVFMISLIPALKILASAVIVEWKLINNAFSRYFFIFNSLFPFLSVWEFLMFFSLFFRLLSRLGHFD